MSEPIRIVGFISVDGDGIRWIDDEGVSGPVQPGPLPESAQQWLDGMPRTKVTFSGFFDAPGEPS